MTSDTFRVDITPKHGLVLRVLNEEVADAFGDYLNELRYIHYEIRYEEDCVEFFFGELASKDKLDDAIANFLSSKSGSMP